MSARRRAPVALATAAALFLLGPLLGPAVARATPQDLFGYGVRSPALAGTGVSFTNDFEAAFANPAGLSRATRRALTVGFHAGVFQVDVDDARLPVDPSRGMVIGFELPLPFGGPFEHRLVLGGGFYTPADALLKGAISYSEVAQLPVMDRVQAAAVQVGLGVDLDGVVDGLRVGASLAVAADVIGELLVRLDETNAFSSTVESQLIATYAPMFGASWEHGDLGLGLVYRHELEGIMDLEVRTADLPLEVPVLSIGGVVHYDPPTLAAEAFYRVTPELRLVGHLTARFWEAYPGPQQKTTRSSNLAPDPDFATVLSPRVAAEWTGASAQVTYALRAGYAYEPSPAPPARLAPLRDRLGATTTERVPLRHLDNDRHVLTAGAGVELELGDGARLSFDLYGQLHLLQPREHEIGRTDGAAPMRTDGRIVVGGWAMGISY